MEENRRLLLKRILLSKESICYFFITKLKDVDEFVQIDEDKLKKVCT